MPSATKAKNGEKEATPILLSVADFDTYTRAFAEAIRDCDKVERFLPLPAQAGSDAILRGMETDALTPDVAKEMIGSIPHCDIVEIPRAHHMVFEENPDAFLAEVSRWLEELKRAYERAEEPYERSLLNGSVDALKSL